MRKSVFVTRIFLLGWLVLAVQPAAAQELPTGDGGFEIDTAPTQNAGFWSQLDRYVGGSLGVMQADGDIVDRSITALTLDFDIPATDRVKTVLSVDVVDYDLTYKQELRDHVRFQQEDNNCGTPGQEACLPLTREREVVGDDTDLREGYVQWDLADFATLRVGRQALVFGQFDHFSPVGFLAPIRSGGVQPRVTKADLSYAQDTVQVSLFPTANLELQLIHAPEIRLDPVQLDGFETFADSCADLSDFFADNTPCSDAKPDIAENDLSIARLAYVGESISWAITAMEGIDQFGEPLRVARLTDQNCGVDENNNNRAFCLHEDKGRQFTKSRAFGLEFSNRISARWTLRAEMTQQEIRESIDLYLLNQQNTGAVLQQAMLAQNGQIYYDSDQHIIAIGGLYEGDKWSVNLQLMSFDTSPKDGRDSLLESAEEAARTPDDDDDDGGVFPLFSVARKLGAENQGYAGVGAGAFFNAYGFGLYGGWTFNETIRIGGLVGATIDVADSGGNLEDENYRGIDDGDTVAQLGVSYLF